MRGDGSLLGASYMCPHTLPHTLPPKPPKECTSHLWYRSSPRCLYGSPVLLPHASPSCCPTAPCCAPHACRAACRTSPVLHPVTWCTLPRWFYSTLTPSPHSLFGSWCYIPGAVATRSLLVPHYQPLTSIAHSRCCLLRLVAPVLPGPAPAPTPSTHVPQPLPYTPSMSYVRHRHVRHGPTWCLAGTTSTSLRRSAPPSSRA